jgi:hypothetical protein
MSAKPMHGGIISENDKIRMSNVEGMSKNESVCLPERSPFRHSAFVIRHFQTIFRAPKDSELLSTCPALRD